MKKFFKILGVVIIGLVVLALILMLSIGKNYHFEKTITINATPEKVYSYMNSSRAFNQWNPWMKLDPNLKLVYYGSEGQVGDRYCWEGNENAGAGCHEITYLEPNKKQSTRMMFQKPFESEATSDIVLIPQNGGTKVTWSMDCELDYPMNLMKLFMDKAMDESYGDGLQQLKALVEKGNTNMQVNE